MLLKNFKFLTHEHRFGRLRRIVLADPCMGLATMSNPNMIAKPKVFGPDIVIGPNTLGS